MRAARLEAGLTQREAAIKAGFASDQVWAQIERGEKNITMDTLDKIAKALGVKAKELVK